MLISIILEINKILLWNNYRSNNVWTIQGCYIKEIGYIGGSWLMHWYFSPQYVLGRYFERQDGMWVSVSRGSVSHVSIQVQPDYESFILNKFCQPFYIDLSVPQNFPIYVWHRLIKIIFRRIIWYRNLVS